MSDESRRDINKKAVIGASTGSIQKQFLFRRIPEIEPIIAKPEIKEVYLNIRKPFDMTKIAGES